MASVQAAAPAVQHPGAPMAAGATKQQAEEMYKKLKHMKESGVPATDPEYIKASQFLMYFQQQHQMRRNQQTYLQQQQQQQQQPGSAISNGAVNGVQQPRSQQGAPKPTKHLLLRRRLHKQTHRRKPTHRPLVRHQAISANSS
uniref:Uncharacterized protein n=1 Tax=Bionectria ochroleuca TaxID=29856 RepID=A0A8H7NAK7_BIOOC